MIEQDLSPFLDELVVANRILAKEDILDAYGHISRRHPFRADRFLLSRARTPECIEVDDFMEFTLAGEPVDAKGRTPYLERFLHAAIYAARPAVNSVIHSHSAATIPFGVCGMAIRPLLHNSALIGPEVRVWDSQQNFGDTALIIPDMAMAEDFASFLGDDHAALMRGHGNAVVGNSVRRAVFVAIKLETAAKLQIQSLAMGNPTFLTPGEIVRKIEAFDAAESKPLVGVDRAWEYWCSRAGLEYRPKPELGVRA